MIKYIKSVLWRVAKRLSYIEDARCLKVRQDATNVYGGGERRWGGEEEVNVFYYTAVLFVQHCMRYDISGRKRNQTG